MARQQVYDNPGPIVDYDTTLSYADKHEKEIREIRSRRHNKKAPQQLGQFPPELEGYDIHTHYFISLPALPIKESGLVVLGEVTDAHAYLSEDRTGVYSEFNIRIDDVLQNRNLQPTTVESSITGERQGGVVRFKNNRQFPFRILDQGMPQVDHQYVFFLNQNKEGEDYHIVTGYQIKQGKVVPLDGSDQFDVYRGMGKEEFLNTLGQALMRQSSKR